MQSREFILKLLHLDEVPVGEFDFAVQLYKNLAEKINNLYGYDGGGRAPSLIEQEDAAIIYAICRLMRPKIVVETGVSDGVSSAMFLAALNRNNEGILLSIDFPVIGTPRVYGKKPGWVVPDAIRTRWKLLQGESSKLLVRAIQSEGRINLFFHDSEHSYVNMYRELLTAASLSESDAILLADDAFENDALLDVAQQMSVDNAQIAFTLQGLGGMRIHKTA